MSRRTALVTIDAEGRDKGKTFLLTEMPAIQAEEWAMRAFQGLARGGLDVPDDIVGMGMAGLRLLGLKAVMALPGIPWGDLRPLLHEMFGCVQFVGDPSRPNVVRGLVEDDIEEVSTRLKLRKELLMLHMDFLKAEDRSTSASAEAA